MLAHHFFMHRDEHSFLDQHIRQLIATKYFLGEIIHIFAESAHAFRSATKIYCQTFDMRRAVMDSRIRRN